MNKVNFNDFLIKGRRIRKTITTPAGNELKIFEPKGADFQDIYNFLIEVEKGNMSAAEMTSKIYPIITNVSFEGLSLDLIEEIINSDAKELELVNEEIALLLTEVSLYKIKRAQVDAEQAKLQAEYMKLGVTAGTAFEALENSLKEVRNLAKEGKLDDNRDKNLQKEDINVTNPRSN